MDQEVRAEAVAGHLLELAAQAAEEVQWLLVRAETAEHLELLEALAEQATVAQQAAGQVPAA